MLSSFSVHHESVYRGVLCDDRIAFRRSLTTGGIWFEAPKCITAELRLEKGQVGQMSRFSGRYIGTKGWESYLKIFVHPPNSLISLPGYLHPLEGRFLYWLGRRVPKFGLAVEVGSFKGKSSSFIASGLSPTARLACIDTWRNDAMPYNDPDDSLPEFLSNVANYRSVIETHRGASTEVASTWNRPIDLLFIDGDHSYEGCSADMKAWIPFVRPCGWIAFHDSGEQGVVRAISELFPRSERGSGLQAWSIFAAKRKR